MKLLLTKAIAVVLIFFFFSWNFSGVNAQCLPTYYTGFLNYGMFYSVGDTITRVTFNTLNNYTGNSAPITDSVYSDYTHLSTTVCKGQSYMLSVWAGDTSVYHTGVIAWIDFNNNNIFETTEMVLRDSVKLQNRTQAGIASVSIPITAVTGSVKMRVLSAYTIASVFPNRMPPNDPCFNYSAVCHDSFPSLIGIPYPDLDPGCNLCISCDALSGEVEEYTINILARPGVSLSGTQTICPGNNVALSFTLSGASPWTLGYTDGTTTTSQTGITQSPYILTLTPSNTVSYSPISLTDNSCFGGVSGSALISVSPVAQVQLSGSNSICPGNGVQLSFNLQGRSPWNFSYSDGTNMVNLTGITSTPWLVTVSPNSTRTYTISSVSDFCGSGGSSGQHAVQVSPALSATLSGGGNLCIGNSAVLTIGLTGVSPWNLSWTDGTNTATQTGLTSSPFLISVSPASTRTFSIVSVSDACNGSGNIFGTAAFQVNPLPTASLNNATAFFCNSPALNFPATLTGTSPWSLTYSNGSSNITQTGITQSSFSIAITPTATVTYSLVTISDNNCTNNSVSGTSVFILDAGPAASLSGTQTICLGQSASFQIAGTNALQVWDFTFSDGTTQTTYTGITSLPYNFSITPASTASYTVSAVNHSCNTASISGVAVLTVASLPTGSLSGPSSYCTGNTVQLSASLTGSAPWGITYSDGSSSVILTGITNNPYYFTLSPQGNVTYTITQVQDAFCSQAQNNSLQVREINPASASLSGGAVICTGSSQVLTTSLNGTAPYEFQWSDGSVTQTISGITTSSYLLNVSPGSSTTYTITQVSNGCGAGAILNSTQVITVSGIPQAVISGNQTLCGTGTANLQVQFSQASGPFSISWTNGTNTYQATGVNTNPYLITQSVAGSQTFTLSSVNNGSCTGTSSGTAEILILPAPAASWQDSFLICPGGSFSSVLSLTGTAPWDVSYSDGINAIVLTGISTSPYSFSQTPAASTTYVLSLVEDVNCQTAASGIIYAELNPLPAAIISVPSPACQGATVPVSVTLAGTAPWSINWTDGVSQTTINGISTSPFLFSITPDTSFSYGVAQLQDAFCTDTNFIPVGMVIQPLPTAHFTLSFTTWDSAQFTNASQNFSSVHWDFGDQSSSTQLNPIHAYTSSANSSVTIKLTASNVCGTAEFDTTLTISGQSISEMLNPIWVRVFPNPVNDFIRITQNEESLILQYMLTDVLGKELNAWKAISHSEEHLSLVDFPAGIYFLKIRSEKYIHSEQIIKIIKY